jgi:hypothetical protein
MPTDGNTNDYKHQVATSLVEYSTFQIFDGTLYGISIQQNFANIPLILNAFEK